MHLVGLAGELTQERNRLVAVRGFAEDPVAERHGRVARQHRIAHQPALPEACPTRFDLGFGHAQHIVARRLIRQRRLVEVRRPVRTFAQQQDLEADADLLEQLAAA
jgi:hypothetical protein